MFSKNQQSHGNSNCWSLFLVLQEFVVWFKLIKLWLLVYIPMISPEKKTFSWIFPWFFPWNHELLPKSLQPRLRWPQSGASEVASAASCAVKCHWGGSPTGRSGKVGSLAQDVLEIGDIGRLYFRLLELKKWYFGMLKLGEEPETCWRKNSISAARYHQNVSNSLLD